MPLGEDLAARLGSDRIGLVGVDAEVFGSFVEDRALHLSVEEKLVERGERDEVRIDLEEIAQRETRVASPEPVRAERCERRLDMGRDHLRQGAHVVGRAGERAAVGCAGVVGFLSGVWCADAAVE